LARKGEGAHWGVWLCLTVWKQLSLVFLWGYPEETLLIRKILL
jgi:hypothetical protein